MKHKAPAALVLVAASIAVAGLQSPAEYRGKGPFQLGSTTISFVGGCRYSPRQVWCWDPTGKFDPKLTTKVADRMAGQIMNFELGMKNRLLMFSWPGSGYIAVPNGESLNTNLGYDQFKHRTQLISVAVPPIQQTIEISGNVQLPPSKAYVDMPFMMGGKVSFLGVNLAYGAAVKSKPAKPIIYPFGGPMQQTGDRWDFVLTSSGAIGGLDVTPLDRDHHPILSVDSNGKAFGPPGKNPRLQDGDRPVPPFSNPYLTTNGTSGGILDINSNVDPSQIHYLRLRQTRQATVVLTDIRLDPPTPLD